MSTGPKPAGQAIGALTVSYAQLKWLTRLNQQAGINANVLLYNPEVSYSIINPKENNRYSYALNNPLRYIDPNGNQVEWVVVGVGVVVIIAYTGAVWYYSQPANTREISKAIDIGIGNAKEKLSSAFSKVKGFFAEATTGDPNQNPFKSKRDELLSKVRNDPNNPLREVIEDLYKPGSQVGDGGTADANRAEIHLGRPVGGKWHIQKGWDNAIRLQKLIHGGQLTPQEIEVAEWLYNDLVNAIMGGW